MSAPRLAGTATAMAAIGLLLHAVVPGPAELVLAATDPQRLADAGGADALVLCLAGALATAVWAWGVLGLLLTAAGSLPGALGAAGRLLSRALLPACLRRGAALVLGVGIGLGGPLLTGAAAATPASVAATTGIPAIPDWPVAPEPGAPPAVPDRPAPHPAGAHVVVRGDCLWTIAARRLEADAGRPPSDGEIATAVQAWWHANAGLIGPDPDLLLPGQVLQAPRP
jgi:hypothetical protein